MLRTNGDSGVEWIIEDTMRRGGTDDTERIFSELLRRLYTKIQGGAFVMVLVTGGVYI
jgi:hypothetical protein